MTRANEIRRKWSSAQAGRFPFSSLQSISQQSCVYPERKNRPPEQTRLLKKSSNTPRGKHRIGNGGRQSFQKVNEELESTRSRLVLATSFSLAEAAVQALTRTRPFLNALDIAGILDDNIIVHDEVGLAMCIVAVLIVVIVMITH